MKSDDPFADLGEEGDRAFWCAKPRSENPHVPGTNAHDLWFRKWDAAANEAARILKSGGINSLHRAAREAAALLRDMRNRPRSTSTTMPRFRQVEAALYTALSYVQEGSFGKEKPSEARQ